MRIDVKEIQNLLYVYNVNFYDMYVDTETGCIDVDMNEMLDNVDVEGLMGELREIFDDVSLEGETLMICYE